MLRALTEFDEKKHIRLMKQYAKEDGLAEGLAEGLTKGMLQERTAVILELLSAYGDVPEKLRTLITGQTNISTLRSWTHIAAHCDGFADFMEKTGCGKQVL